ncbi:MAG: hypothetical protein ACKO7A_33495, partial [Microcystis sp.]
MKKFVEIFAIVGLVSIAVFLLLILSPSCPIIFGVLALNSHAFRIIPSLPYSPEAAIIVVFIAS